MSIAMNLVEQLERLIEQHAATCVVEVEVECGVLQQVVPEALELAFAAATADTPACGAKLLIIEREIAARCRGCGTRFDARIDEYRCPRCGAADADVLAGRDIVLKSVVLEAVAGPDSRTRP
jgi:hydrogenase nickel incorporation protein HypA/HybF